MDDVMVGITGLTGFSYFRKINTITYDVSDVNLFPPHLNEIPPQKRGVTGAPYTTNQ